MSWLSGSFFRESFISVCVIAVEQCFPNWGTRTPRGTQSGSGGTRGENSICVFKVKKPITFSHGARNRHEILNSPNSQVALPEILMYTHIPRNNYTAKNSYR